MIRLAIRNAFRNVRRTLLTATTVVIGTALTVLTLAFMGGIFNSMIDTYANQFGHFRVVHPDYLEKELLRPLHLNLEEVQPLLERVRSVPGVVSAEPSIRIPVIMTIGEEIGEDGGLLVGAPTAFYDKHLLPDATLVAGEWLSASDDEQVVVGARLASEIGAAVGDELLLLGQTQYGSMSPVSADVVGIVSGNSSIDQQAYVTFETARWLVDIPDGAIEIQAYAEDFEVGALGPVVDRVQAAIGTDATAQPWFERNLWPSTLPILQGMQAFIGGLVTFVMALAIFNTMTISVLERTAEIGVMRAMGQSRWSAIGTFLIEAAMIGALGGAVGVVLGAIPSLYLQEAGWSFPNDVVDRMGTEFPIQTQYFAALSLDVVVTSFLVGVITAVIAAALPALRAARIQPHEAMRARR